MHAFAHHVHWGVHVEGNAILCHKVGDLPLFRELLAAKVVAGKGRHTEAVGLVLGVEGHELTVGAIGCASARCHVHDERHAPLVLGQGHLSRSEQGTRGHLVGRHAGRGGRPFLRTMYVSRGAGLRTSQGPPRAAPGAAPTTWHFLTAPVSQGPSPPLPRGGPRLRVLGRRPTWAPCPRRRRWRWLPRRP